MEKTSKDIVCCGRIVNVYGTHENIEFNVSKIKEYSKEDAIRQVLLLNEIDVSSCDKIYKKKLFNKLRFPEGKISEDAAVIMQLLNESNGVAHAGKPYYHYVFRKKSISKSSYSIKNLDVLENIDNTKKYIKDNYPKLYNEYKIYDCLTSAAQLILRSKDKKAKKQFNVAYLKFKKIFKDGYELTKNRNDISNKKKFELFCIRYNLITLYSIIKRIYQLKYILIK